VGGGGCYNYQLYVINGVILNHITVHWATNNKNVILLKEGLYLYSEESFVLTIMDCAYDTGRLVVTSKWISRLC
jgi:hypothetical protein